MLNKNESAISLSTLPSVKNPKNYFPNQPLNTSKIFSLKAKLQNSKSELYLIKKTKKSHLPQKITKKYEHLILNSVFLKNNLLIKKADLKEAVKKMEKVKTEKKKKIEEIDKEINKLLGEINHLIINKKLESVNISQIFSKNFFASKTI
jgi:hypothetical protein